MDNNSNDQKSGRDDDAIAQVLAGINADNNGDKNQDNHDQPGGQNSNQPDFPSITPNPSPMLPPIPPNVTDPSSPAEPSTSQSPSDPAYLAPANNAQPNFAPPSSDGQPQDNNQPTNTQLPQLPQQDDKSQASAMAPTMPTTPTAPVDPALDGIKKNALSELRPLVDKLNVSNEEKFDTYLLLLRSTDDKSLLGPAHEAAKGITDEARRANALLEIIKEVDFLSHGQQKES